MCMAQRSACFAFRHTRRLNRARAFPDAALVKPRRSRFRRRSRRPCRRPLPGAACSCERADTRARVPVAPLIEPSILRLEEVIDQETGALRSRKSVDLKASIPEP